MEKQMNYLTKYTALITLYDIAQKTHGTKTNKYDAELTVENYDA